MAEEEKINQGKTEESQVESEDFDLREGLKGFDDISLKMKVVLGKTRMSVGSFLKLTRGSVLELETKLSDKLEVEVNGKKIADSDIAVQDEDIIAVEVNRVYKPEKL